MVGESNISTPDMSSDLEDVPKGVKVQPTTVDKDRTHIKFKPTKNSLIPEHYLIGYLSLYWKS